MLRRPAYLLLCLTIASSLLAADTVPLSASLRFDVQENRSPEAITLVVPTELAHLNIQKRMRLLRLDFPLGNAVAANTESALRSAYEKVRLARSAEDADSRFVLEAKSFEVEPRMPVTTFGTFTSRVRFTFALTDTKGGSSREIVVEGDGGNKKHAGRVLWESGWKWTEAQQLAKATDLATLDALDNLLEELRK